MQQLHRSSSGVVDVDPRLRPRPTMSETTTTLEKPTAALAQKAQPGSEQRRLRGRQVATGRRDMRVMRRVAVLMGWALEPLRCSCPDLLL